MEEIFTYIFAFSLVFVVVCVVVTILWYITVDRYCDYKLYRRSNRIQWNCIETSESFTKRVISGDDTYQCTLIFRILPSELSKFVRIFGNNKWIPAFDTKFTFSNREDFVNSVKNFKTYGDFMDYKDKQEGVLWIEPEK